jgi:hypothetical protein
LSEDLSIAFSMILAGKVLLDTSVFRSGLEFETRRLFT